MVKNAINLKTPASGALIALRRETYVGTLSHLGVRVFVYPNTRSTFMAQKLICSACGHIGSSKTAVKGSILIEIVLWLCFIIPGIIYSLWRSSSRHKTCPKCGGTNLIPLDSPVGLKILSDQGKTLEQAQTEKEPARVYTKGEKLMFIVVAIVVIALITLFNNV
jgi:hypothetical protein